MQNIHINGWTIALIIEPGFDFKYRATKNGHEEKFYTLTAAKYYVINSKCNANRIDVA